MSPLMLLLSQTTVPAKFDLLATPQKEKYLPFFFTNEVGSYYDFTPKWEKETGITIIENTKGVKEKPSCLHTESDLYFFVTLWLSETNLFLSWYNQLFWDEAIAELPAQDRKPEFTHDVVLTEFRTKDYALTVDGFYRARLEMTLKIADYLQGIKFHSKKNTWGYEKTKP